MWGGFLAGLVNELIKILNTEADNLSDFLGLAKEKTQVIVENDVKSLQKIVELENILASRQNKLEKSRIAIMADIAMVLNKDLKELTLKRLAEIISIGNEKEELLKLQEKLKLITEQLKQANDVNKLLIENSLEYIEFTMNVIRGVAKEDNYTEPINASGINRFFDAKQ